MVLGAASFLPGFTRALSGIGTDRAADPVVRGRGRAAETMSSTGQLYRGRVEIRLWSVVAEPVALAAAGPGAEEAGGAGAWFAAGPDAVVVIVTGGVRTEEDLTVPGPVPPLVERHLAGRPEPLVLVFARLAEGCLSLGAARVTRIGRRRGAVQDLGLRLDAPLRYELLDRVRPTGPPGPQPDVDWIDLAPTAPLTALHHFVTGWYGVTGRSGGPVDPEDGGTRAGLPAPLTTFHRIVAGRDDLCGRALRIFPEAVPTEDPGLIAFGQEADGVVTLLTESSGDDPPVWYAGLSDRPLRERVRLSAYLLLATLTHTAMDSAPGGMAFVDRAQVKRIVAPLRRVPLRPTRWPCARSRLYAGPGVVALVGAAEDGDWYEVYLGARHRSLLRRLRKLGLDWESFDG